MTGQIDEWDVQTAEEAALIATQGRDAGEQDGDHGEKTDGAGSQDGHAAGQQVVANVVGAGSLHVAGPPDGEGAEDNKGRKPPLEYAEELSAKRLKVDFEAAGKLMKECRDPRLKLVLRKYLKSVRTAGGKSSENARPEEAEAARAQGPDMQVDAAMPAVQLLPDVAMEGAPY